MLKNKTKTEMIPLGCKVFLDIAQNKQNNGEDTTA